MAYGNGTRARARKTSKTTDERRRPGRALQDRLTQWQADADPALIAMALARHDGYSERNAMLIAMQDPDATDVSGFKAWIGRGRCVRKGEHGLMILAPTGTDAGKGAEGGDATADPAGGADGAEGSTAGSPASSSASPTSSTCGRPTRCPAGRTTRPRSTAMHDSEARSIAGQVARYLPGGGWAPDASWDGCGAILAGPDGARLHLTGPRDGKVHVSGCFPMTDMRVKSCGINVGAARPPAVIAAEITRRLLPGYLGQLRQVNEHNDREERDRETRAQVIGKFAAMFPGSHVRTAGHRGMYTEALLNGGGSVEAYGAASTVKIELRSIPADVAAAMLAVLAGSRRGSDDGNAT